MTPRQELVSQSGIRLQVMRQRNKLATAYTAIEAITDECLACKPGTLGAAMLSYFRGASELALARLREEVFWEAKGGKKYRQPVPDGLKPAWYYWQIMGSYGAKYSKDHYVVDGKTLCGRYPNPEYSTELLRGQFESHRCLRCAAKQARDV